MAPKTTTATRTVFQIAPCVKSAPPLVQMGLPGPGQPGYREGSAADTGLPGPGQPGYPEGSAADSGLPGPGQPGYPGVTPADTGPPRFLPAANDIAPDGALMVPYADPATFANSSLLGNASFHNPPLSPPAKVTSMNTPPVPTSPIAFFTGGGNSVRVLGDRWALMLLIASAVLLGSGGC